MLSGQDQLYDMHKTLSRLLDVQSKQGSDQNSLVMLSLVNLMGIIDILNKRVQASPAAGVSGNLPLDLSSLQTMLGPLLNIFAKQGQGDCKTQPVERNISPNTDQGCVKNNASMKNSVLESANDQSNKSANQDIKPRVVNPLGGLLNLLGGGGSQPNLVPLLALLGLCGGANQPVLTSLLSLLNNQSNQKADIGALVSLISGLAGSHQAAAQNKVTANKAESPSAGEARGEESCREEKNKIIVKKGI
ncbi:hypothetical protein Dtox_0194 [Desulfofarcimen acetoxidans DSM 771]|uniref:Uncharacterized protein n=1 Tax=Desulfofarcimen acetoxidans (strain ATCC 49208 / DSM 771 / KCTC 5769 / VKM B-1644 / 5575) TaxID=485916 RepID=C8W2Z1_DESAS|nr:hypothetical protein [Desulfofarcimen acetoxidans]ACV61147.1 hypothetical protein Dtox_0194 [Desulfofarcimen acetoxidans DSM 771]